MYLFIIFLCLTFHEVTSQSSGCSAVRHAYSLKGFSASDVPRELITGSHLRICHQGFGCCTAPMETKLNAQSQDEYDKYVADQVQLIHTIFISKTARFDAFFSELLDDSYKDLHDMFTRTYGLLYQSNSYIFQGLFSDLRSYYRGGDINLLDALDDFFTTLLQKMFELLNGGYTFDEEYLQCVSDNMDDLKPFGDVPHKLAIQVKRAFIAARTFVQGLSMGRDIILEVSKMKPTQSCQDGLMKMLYCPYCRGLTDVAPCNNFCMNIMKGCLAQQSELNSQWNAYTSAMIKLAERLEGPFNIESVVDPIDVKISEAIMNLQENSDTVSKKVFAGCGQPRARRKKRDVPDEQTAFSEDSPAGAPLSADNPVRRSAVDEEVSDDTVRRSAADDTVRRAVSGDNQNINDYNYNRRNKNHGRHNNGKHNSMGGESDSSGGGTATSLDRLVNDIKKKVANTRDFWRNLPHAICSSAAAPVTEEDNCWNGVSRTRYQPEVMRDGLLFQNNNPEVEVDVRRKNIVIQQQLLNLQTIINKLKNAYNGVDVDYIDTADTFISSGSGGMEDGSAGSGSGMNQYDDTGIFFGKDRSKYPEVFTQSPNRNRNRGGQNTKNTQNSAYDYQPTHSHSAPVYSSISVLLVSVITVFSMQLLHLRSNPVIGWL